MATPPNAMSHLLPHSGKKCDRPGGRRHFARWALLAVATAIALSAWGPATAGAGPSATRLAYATGTIVPIPAAIPHQEGSMIDRRILPNLRWIAARFPIYVSEGYSGPLPGGGERIGCNGCHVRGSDHYNGLAVDILPLRWSDSCDGSWRGITRLSRWAEPRQNQPVPPFRWVGYDGDAGHGCGDHLHLSWEHAPAPQFQLAEWVEVFPVSREGTPAPAQPEQALPPPPQPERKRQRRKRPGPSGGISKSQSGGLSPRGD